MLPAIILCLGLICPADGGQKSKRPVRKPNQTAPAGVHRKIEADYGTNNFSYRTAESRTRRLSDFGGNTVLVSLWTTPCVPCSVQARGFVGIYEKYHASGFEILSIGLNVGESEIRSFVTTTGASWPVGVSDSVAEIFGSYGLPDNYLFNPDGSLARHFIGYLKPGVLEPVVRESLRKFPGK